jgi:hypothetical protein
LPGEEKPENCFSSFVALHDGQTAVSPEKTNCSNLVPHFLQMYSYSGIIIPQQQVYECATQSRFDTMSRIAETD